MLIGALTFPGSGWSWLALAAAVVLVPLAWLSFAPAGARTLTTAVGLALRTLGIGLLALCLLDPQWTARRAVRGANLFAVVADNSQGLQVIDRGSTSSRGELLREHLNDAGSSWLARLAETFLVRSYVFDRDLRRVRDFGTLDFSGDRTALARSLQRVRERNTGQPLAGVLLFTDGNATDVPDGTTMDLAGLPPVYPVMVGRDGVRDVRIDGATVRQTAFDDAPVTLQVDIAGDEAGSGEVDIAVRRIGGPDESASGEAAVAAQTRRLRSDGGNVPVTFTWRPQGGGVQFFETTVTPRDAENAQEATAKNNQRMILLDRGRAQFRILYVGGRPSWEFKFLNRALLDDPRLGMVGLLRVARREPKFDFRGRAGEASNPMYRGFDAAREEAPRYDEPVLVRVNTRDETELRGGFPQTAEELFAFDAVVLDDIEATFFSLDQLSLLRRFAAERGGGLLMLGGADSLENGGYASSPLAAALPLYLDRPAAAPPAGALRWQLTREGWVEPWVRVRSNEADEQARLGAMPPIMVAHGLEHAKPAATVLARVTDEQGRSFPSLVSQRFGLGRVACLTAGDLWRWGLHGEGEQADLARFWRQLARWLVTDVPAQVTLVAEPEPTDQNSSGMRLKVTARDRAYRPVESARVQVHVRRLDVDSGATAARGFTTVDLPAEPGPGTPGEYVATLTTRDAGAYRAEAHVVAADGTPVGRAETGWIVDPAEEEFRSLVPNRGLLAEIARRTGGEIVAMNALDRFVERLPERPAPVSEAWSFPVWHNAWVFLAVLGCFIAEWAWRRWRGLA